MEERVGGKPVAHPTRLLRRWSASASNIDFGTKRTYRRFMEYAHTQN
jgi:hypothetical protein